MRKRSYPKSQNNFGGEDNEDGSRERKRGRIQMKKNPKLTSILPYDLNSLAWDDDHRSNEQNCYCYCGCPGRWSHDMLRCHECRQWFHRDCISCPTDSLVYGDLLYVFYCSICFQEEYYIRLGVAWSDLAHLALLNLTKEKADVKCFDLKSDILPWICIHWQRLKAAELEKTTLQYRKQQLLEAMRKDHSRFLQLKLKFQSAKWSLRNAIPLLPSYIDFSDLPSPPPLRPTQPENTSSSKRRLRVRRLASTIQERRQLDGTLEGQPKDQKHPRRQLKRLHQTNLTSKNPSANGLCRTAPPASLTSIVLDRIIPIPQSYDGLDHPFKTPQERENEKRMIQCRSEALSVGFCRSAKDPDCQGFNFLTNDKERALRRQNQLGDSFNFSGVDVVNHPSPQRRNGLEKNVEDALNEEDIPLSQLRSWVSSRLESIDLIVFGEHGVCLGKRIASGNKVQYLMEWQ